MEFTPYLLIAAILLAGSLLQGAVGFAFALLTVPLLVQSGLPLSEAVALITLPVSTQLLLGTFKLRRFVQWREVSFASLIRLLTLPLGMLLLVFFDGLEPSQLQQVLGVAVLIAVLLQLLSRSNVVLSPHRAWRYIAFASSGLMQGAVSMGGPPAVLWVMAQPWSNQQSRAFLQAMFLVISPIHISLLISTLGTRILPSMLLGLLFTPLVILGALLGMRIGDILSKALLRQLALGILIVNALAAILRH